MRTYVRPAAISAGTVQLNVALVAPVVGFVAHVRSASDITPSRLKSIQPHNRAVRSTPTIETGRLYVLPISATPSAPKDDTPSSVAGIAAPALTASALVVPYSTFKLSAVTAEPNLRLPTTWLAAGVSYPAGN